MLTKKLQQILADIRDRKISCVRRSGSSISRRLESMEPRFLLANSPNVISVAIVSTGSGGQVDAGFVAAAAQINDDTHFNFTASVVTPAQVDTTTELSAYDVVLIGNGGSSQNADPFQNSAFASALSTWVQTLGGGLVASGYSAWGITNNASSEVIIDGLVPIAGFGTELFNSQGSISTNSSHPVTAGVGTISIVNQGSSVETSASAIDSGATAIGTVSGPNGSGAGVVVSAKGNGRSVYLAPSYVGGFTDGSGTATFNWLRNGAPDRLLEQALAWASTNPVISNGVAVVSENTAAGSVLLSVPTNAITTGATLNYSILSGNPDSLFGIDSSGQIRILPGVQLNYETQQTHTLTINATYDDGTPKSDTAVVTIHVLDDSPTVTINQADEQAGRVNTGPILFDVVFSDPVTGFDPSDISFAGSTVSGALVASISGSGAAYAVSVTGMTGSGVVTASILAGAASDSGAVNPSLSSTSTDNSVEFDITKPTIVSIDDDDSNDVVPVGQPRSFTVAFDEDIDGATFTDADLRNAGTSQIIIGSFVETSPGVFTVNVTPTTSGTLIFEVVASASILDLAGNAANVPAVDNNTLIVDGSSLTVVSIDDGDADNVSRRGTTLNYIVTFSKDVDETTVSAADFENAGTASLTIGAISETSPGVISVSVTPNSIGTLILRVAPAATILDLAGNNVSAPTDDDTIVGIEDSLNVAIVRSGVGGATDAGFTQAAGFLNNDSYFDFSATVVTAAAVDSLAELLAYDVVVIGNAGNSVNDDPFTNAAFATALESWVNTTGGGIVATGYTAFGISNTPGTAETDIDDIVPIAGTGSSVTNFAGSVSITNTTHPLTAGVSSFSISNTGFTTVEASASLDSGATSLATASGPNGAGHAVVVANKGGGRSVYLGPAYVGSSSGSGAGPWSWLGSGNPDRLLEQAVAWASTKPVLANHSATSTENRTANSTIATISANAISTGSTLEYSIIDGNTDGAFAINSSGNITVANADALDFETNPVFTLLVNVIQNDGTAKSDFAAVTISLSNVNEAPSNLTLSETSIAENQVSGATVGVFSSTDPDAGNLFNYTFIAGAGDTNNSLFGISGNQLTVNSSFDFETNNSYSVRIRTTDAGGLFFDRSFTINVTNVNEGPTDASVSSSTVAENSLANAEIGSFSSVDPDAGDTFSYAFASGTGSEDNAAFTIVGNQLRANSVFDFETKNSFSIRVRSTDAGGLWFERTFTITVTNVEEDVTAPVSAIGVLPAAVSSLSIPISVSGSDPGTNSSGIKEYDLYYSTGGSFVFFATVPAASPSTTFTGSANTTYWFRSLGRDNAGNVETKTTSDTYTRIGDVVAPATQVTSAVPNSSGLFNVQMTGTKVGGTALTVFDVYVSIDGNAPVLVGSANGVSLGSGNYSGQILFQGVLDGTSHTYRFYSRGRDGAGNMEAAPVSGDILVTHSFAAAGLTATAIDVQNGIRQRSYVRYLDVLFSSATGVDALLNAGRVKVERFAIDAASVTPGNGVNVPGAVLAQNGNRLRLDFGTSGLGGLRQAGNGFYRVLLDMDGNGSFADVGDNAFEFHRLFGDANGDAKVDEADTALVTSQIGRTGSNLDGDLDGNNSVNSTDRLYTTQQRGKKLLDPLVSWLDD